MTDSVAGSTNGGVNGGVTGGATGGARWFAPGRVNLIGDHTDHQLGWVLPFAIGAGTHVTLDLTDTSTLEVRSSVFGPAAPRPLSSLAEGPSGWAAYLEGAVAVAMRRGLALGGVRVDVTSSLPVGAGLASSAAITCATLAAVHEAAGVDAPPEAIADMAQEAENNYVGTGVGYMDPAAVMLGRVDHALAIDTRERTVEALPLRVEEAGLTLLLVDTHQRHRTSGADYRTRVQQCREASLQLRVASLRDVTDPDVVAAIQDPVVRARARHVVSENLRVRQAAELLRAGRVSDVGELMVASHASLRDDFASTTPALDAVVGIAMGGGAVGARVTGAGFGGSVLVLVDRELVSAVTDAAAEEFARRRWATPTAEVVAPSGGAHSMPFGSAS